MTLIAGSSSGLWGEAARAGGPGFRVQATVRLVDKVPPPPSCAGDTRGGGNKQDLTRQRATALPHSYTLGGGDSGYSSSYLGQETMQILLLFKINLRLKIIHFCASLKPNFLHLGPHKSRWLFVVVRY